METKTFEPGTFVRHKLGKEKLLVLPNVGGAVMGGPITYFSRGTGALGIHERNWCYSIELEEWKDAPLEPYGREVIAAAKEFCECAGFVTPSNLHLSKKLLALRRAVIGLQ